MRYLILIYLIIGLISLSCQSRKTNTEIETKKTKILLHDLSDKHPNKMQMEYFLNNYKEEFLKCDLNMDSLKNQSLIQKQYSFQIKDSSLSLLLIFCEGQNDALAVAEANFVSKSTTQKYGVNGATLFVVEGTDKYEIDDVLSHFAGEE